jgi:hypothetical protein
VSNGAKDEEEGEKGKHERQMINDRRVHLKNREDALRNAASMNKQREIHPPTFFLFETKIQKMFLVFFALLRPEKNSAAVAMGNRQEFSSLILSFSLSRLIHNSRSPSGERGKEINKKTKKIKTLDRTVAGRRGVINRKENK